MNGSYLRSALVRRSTIALLTSLVAICHFAAPARVSAQDRCLPGDRIFGSHFDMARSLYLWLNYTDGDSFGRANQHVGVGGTYYVLPENGALLLTGQGLVSDQGMGGASLGMVRRWLLSSCFGPFAVGAGLHADYNKSPRENDYFQGVISGEVFTENWAFRLNGYGILGERVNTIGGTGAGPVNSQPFFQENFLLAGVSQFQADEEAMHAGEVELARNVGGLFGIPLGLDINNNAAEVFVGYYRLESQLGPDADGIKGGLRGYLFPGLAANVQVWNDRVFGTGVYGGFTWFFGGDGGNLPGSVEDKLTIPVQRNYQVAVNEVITSAGSGVIPLTDGGIPILFNHVNDSGVAGDGTFENPHGSLVDANNDMNKANRDIVYVHSGTTFTNQNYVAAVNQRVLGEGSSNTQAVVTDQLGRINLPQVNGLGNPRPVLSFIPNAVSGAIVVANNTEVSNFQIQNSGAAIFASGVTGDVNVNRTLITGGGAGIDIIGGSGRFSFTDVTVADTGSAGLLVNGGSSTINFGGMNDPVAGLFGPSVITQSGGGTAVRIVNGHSGVLTQTPSSPIFADSGDGLQFDNADGQYNFNGPVTLAGGDAGIDIINDSAGTFTFSNTDITNPTGTGLNVDGGDSDVIFQPGGSITQGNNASAVIVQGGHTGQLDVDGTINATNGDGLQFDDADGTYNFGGQVTLNGGDAGIDIVSDSAGTFTFSNTSITDPTGVGLNIDGGDADVTFQAPGSIVQNTFNQPLIDAMGGHTGTVTFELGTNLEATNGTGLQFVDADGEYIFNGGITLDGTANSADTGIDIISDSAGTFTFAGLTSITNDQGTAVNIDGGGAGQAAQVTFNELDVQQSIGAGVRANNSGSLTIDFGDIDNTTGDGINVTNTNLTVNLAQFGINVGIGDDGIEVVNNDAIDRTAIITSNNIFGLGGSSGIANRGIFINSSGTGTLEADVRFNFIVSTNQTILTTSGPTAGSLILDLQNSTLTTDTPAVFTEEHVGGALHSTIVRSWSSPNQVIGAVISGTGGGGILFDRVTFDADANPGNGFQQVQYTGDLDIGSVPPLTITRVTGDGLSFINPTGDLSIQTLNVANFNGTGLNVDTSGLGTTFNLSVGGGTIDTSGGDAVVLNGVNGFSLNNSTVNNGAGFDTVDVTGSNVSGMDNTAPNFSCTNGGGNSGSISFNGGSNTCP